MKYLFIFLLIVGCSNNPVGVNIDIKYASVKGSYLESGYYFSYGGIAKIKYNNEEYKDTTDGGIFLDFRIDSIPLCKNDSNAVLKIYIRSLFGTENYRGKKYFILHEGINQIYFFQ